MEMFPLRMALRYRTVALCCLSICAITTVLLIAWSDLDDGSDYSTLNQSSDETFHSEEESPPLNVFVFAEHHEGLFLNH